MNLKFAAIFSTVGLMFMTYLGVKMYLNGSSIIFILFPAAMTIFSLYALWSRR